jgi:hypothetical protein
MVTQKALGDIFNMQRYCKLYISFIISLISEIKRIKRNIGHIVIVACIIAVV